MDCNFIDRCTQRLLSWDEHGIFNITTKYSWSTNENSIYPSSLAVYYFYISLFATDWPSTFSAYVMLGIEDLPNNYGRIFRRRLGIQRTWLCIYILNDLRFLGTNACIDNFVAHYFYGKNLHGILSGAFTPAFLPLASYFSGILFMIVFPGPIMCVLGLGQKFRCSWLHATVAIGTAMTPINHVFMTAALTEHATGIAISNAQYMLIGISAGLVLRYRDVGCS